VPSEQAIYEGLAEIFREAFMRDNIQLRPELSAKDVADWDSLKQIMIITGVEQHFGVRFTTRELDRLRCVGDLVRIIQTRGS